MNQEALIVFAKVPVPGKVKTRLTPGLSPEQAARLYEAFIRDSLRQYVQCGAAVRLYLAPSAEDLPAGIVPEGVTVHLQRGEGLGARMQRAFIETFGAGYGHAVVIGTDHPSLPPEFVQIAFESLGEPLSVCIGPSADGGYYLLGMNDLFLGLFEDMRYSHAGVYRQTLERIEASRANLTILPEWYDVDTIEDLKQLASDLADPSVAAPSTRTVVNDLASVLSER